MKNYIATGAAVLAAIAIPTSVRAGNCEDGSEEIDGNWYCSAVDTIQYTGLGGSGTYDKVTYMDSTTGTCNTSTYSYSGSIAPYNEELSVHFRGPIQLKQFAFYTTTSSSKMKREEPQAELSYPRARRHGIGHGHDSFHQRNKEIREIQEQAKAEELAARSLPEVWVTVTMDGQVVSWINEWTGEATSTASSVVAAATSTVASVTSAAVDIVEDAVATSTAETSSSVAYATSTTSSAASSTSSTTSGSGDSAWTRSAYYDASAGTASGLVFLNNYGGTGSGVWDDVFGNSLSYANEAATSGATEATVLSDVTVGSDDEFIIFTDTSCEDESGCGYYRPGTTAYHGFSGTEKVFLFEFAMPSASTTSGTDADMPAVWMLNALIPRTGEYLSEDCTCWESGCGEFDLFEVLTSGSARAKSTFHGNQAAGDSDYFVRPVNSTIKMSVVMMDDTATIKILSDDFDITSTLSAAIVSELQSTSWTDITDGLGASEYAL